MTYTNPIVLTQTLSLNLCLMTTQSTLSAQKCDSSARYPPPPPTHPGIRIYFIRVTVYMYVLICKIKGVTKLFFIVQVTKSLFIVTMCIIGVNPSLGKFMWRLQKLLYSKCVQHAVTFIGIRSCSGRKIKDKITTLSSIYTQFYNNQLCTVVWAWER